ncbi:sn-glycerol-3-phosphate transport system permease protein ugpA [Mesomycoplasma conjunctivae]|uniref:Sn-glycerol-3-phosphate transport system perme n=1 Tax=Mesomycoplasma conjunctivae (strain ATCC 25834 / NCTC 10147 / HRC/581) TaxID=572263 RepID=C5J5H4_MESCH|nr:sugar ABC transporter permease [Mesomycoplasma conjunctivae]CAT04696.1 Sn-glycerol-3-phosphate transport system perme [Mesomycoplasma conjunctivae]VEU65672.1 sn-glycerol-3-phosphate transport system permease protein ugpA [Mesomycoplasma conjunctivae]
MNLISNWLYLRRIKKKNIDLGILDKKTKFWKPFLLLLPSILVILIFTFLPFIFSVTKSFSVQINPNRASSIKFGFNNFTRVLYDENFQIAVRNSAIYALVALPITLVISLIIASTLASLHRKYARGFWQTVFFLPYVTSGIAVSVAFAFIFDSENGFINSIFNINVRWLNSGRNNSFLALLVILASGVWRNLAFEVLILTTAMVSVNPVLYKAAAIDGASKTTQFFRITLPSVSKTINFLITIGIISGIKVFPIGIFPDTSNATLNGGQTMLLFIYREVSESRFALAGSATIYLFIFGVALSIVVKKGLNSITWLWAYMGERNVYNKIKNTKTF